jgi:HEPN domain-containing protein
MSYDPNDAARDEFYEQISRELYPEHRLQAIDEFTAERLSSFYIKYPDVMRPALEALHEGTELLSMKRYSPAVVFFVSSIELFLKATLLKPVVYGLVHHEALADIIVTYTLGQTGFERYESLLEDLFAALAKMDIKEISRKDSETKLLIESKELQKLRNRVIHQGAVCTEAEAKKAFLVSVAVFELIVEPMLGALGLMVQEGGSVKPA